MLERLDDGCLGEQSGWHWLAEYASRIPAQRHSGGGAVKRTLGKMLLLAVLTTSAAAFMIKLSRKVPRAVLCRGTLSVWCYQCEEGGLSKREQERLRIPLHEIERVWVGRPKDYQGSWPCPGF